MDYRTEHDSMGEMAVPSEMLYGAQTARSLENFKTGAGIETMPKEIIRAFGIMKKACALANLELVPERMTKDKAKVIEDACDRIISGELDEHFPLVVWQTGSGTQTNMNVNEVAANLANRMAGRNICHPNDDVNMSQSSNDTFPSALHIAAVLSVENELLPSAEGLIDTFSALEKKYEGVIKTGRTHLMDAVPIAFSQEISGWRASLERGCEMLRAALSGVRELALGGTAVGTGLNAPERFGERAAEIISEMTGTRFCSASNKFHSLTSKDEIVFLHGAVKALAADMMKIANDVRMLASGPRTGIGEISIPANEPGSSIMPGKVNPTQCEQVTMVAVQVMGNDAAIGIAASQGNFELNVFLPVTAYNFLQSTRLLAGSIRSFDVHCASGIVPNEERMRENLTRSLMTVTALSPYIGYERAAEAAMKADREGISLRDAVTALEIMSGEEFDEKVRPEKMV